MKVAITTWTEDSKQKLVLYMYNVLKASLLDLGYYTDSCEEADVVIAIQGFPGDKPFVRKSGVKYIWWNIENIRMATYLIGLLRPSEKVDSIWGFDIDVKDEIYTPIGYHPSFDFTDNVKDRTYVYEIGFIGWFSPKRKKFYSNAGINVVQFPTYELKKKFDYCYHTKINLDSRSQISNTRFTCWDRLSFLIANKCFVLSENCYFPSVWLPQFEENDHKDCREKIDFFLNNENQRLNNVECLYEWYKKNMLMVNIIEDRLRLLK